MTTSTHTHGAYTWTETDLGTITLGRTTYRAMRQTHTSGDAAGTSTVHLTGPRGAGYFLRGYLGEDTGLRQVISWKSGAPLRDSRTQAEVRVLEFGDHIELHVPHPAPIH